MRNSKLSRDALLSREFPHYHIVASPEYAGLSGSSCILQHGERRLVLRQYHALRQLPATLAPKPVFYTRGWMAVDFLAGEIKSVLPAHQPLATLLYDLHQQPRFGWRLALLPLLERYWQQCSPSRRTPFWLRSLQRLRQRKEPRPLRLAPLHMDVHGDNIVRTDSGLRLIDWEYAGDGDIALELAAVWVSDESQHQRLVSAYAQRAHIEQDALWRQVRRWQIWIMMLKAGWFEYRWQQTGERQFIRLADETWRQLTMKG